jgi:hypothetical protein
MEREEEEKRARDWTREWKKNGREERRTHTSKLNERFLHPLPNLMHDRQINPLPLERLHNPLNLLLLNMLSERRLIRNEDEFFRRKRHLRVSSHLREGREVLVRSRVEVDQFEVVELRRWTGEKGGVAILLRHRKSREVFEGREDIREPIIRLRGVVGGWDVRLETELAEVDQGGEDGRGDGGIETVFGVEGEDFEGVGEDGEGLRQGRDVNTRERRRSSQGGEMGAGCGESKKAGGGEKRRRSHSRDRKER